MPKKRRIGCDLDGCLAEDIPDEPFDYKRIGKPVPAMLQVIKEHLEAGDEVFIFTARASTKDHFTIFNGTEEEYLKAIKEPIERWCLEHLGQVLPISAEKDYRTTIYYDDRARQVIRNTGEIVCAPSY